MITLSLKTSAFRPGPVNTFAGLVDFLILLSASAGLESNQTVVNTGDINDIRQSIRGDNDAYRRLIERYQQRISSMMWRFSRDRTIHEELVQDVFVEAYMSLPTFKQKSPFSHWLCRIATRVGYNYWKNRTKQAAVNMVRLQDWDQNRLVSTENPEADRAAEILEHLLEKLPPRDRLVVMLRYVEQHSVEKTAELTGWSVAMVKVQTWRAKKKLAAIAESIKNRDQYY